MKRVFENESVIIHQGDAVDWPGEELVPHIDLVLTNPYGPLPASLHKAPMLVHQWEYNKGALQRWIGGADLKLVSTWNEGRECFWAANMPKVPDVNLEDLKPEPGGWYPLELPRRLLERMPLHLHFDRPTTVWDGFMGRGTVARACVEMGFRYIGVEQLDAHIALAMKYLDLEAHAADGR
jgi:hypothetical protein